MSFRKSITKNYNFWHLVLINCVVFIYPCRLWGKPKEVNVWLHVGSDDLNLKKSRSKLRVQGFENLLTYDSMTFITICHNPSLRLMTKVRACEVAGQEWAQKSHFMIPRVQKSVREWTLPLPNGFLNFQRAITAIKSHWIEMFFISLKSS
jgi:hypothetical protein